MDLSEFDIDFLSQKLSDNPQSPLFARLADLYLIKKQSSEALKLCEAGVQTYPSYATGYVILGKCYLALNENSKARLAFTQALQLSPFNQLARKFLSEIPHTVDERPRAVEDEIVAASSYAVETQPALEAEPQVVASVAEEEIVAPPSVAEEEITPTSAVEEPVQVAEEIVDALQAEEVVAVQQAAEVQPVEPTQFPNLDDYIQQHSTNIAAERMISLDEYLGPAPAVSAQPQAPMTELDSLTAQLENAKRIVPQETEPEASPKENVLVDSTVITPTLAEIYASQGEYGTAIQAYEILIVAKPNERERFEKRIKELQAKLYDVG